MASIPEGIARRFADFRADPLEQFRVRLRRFRAGQLRDLLGNPDALTVDDFNHEVWRLETRTMVDGEPIRTGEIFDLDGMTDERRAELEAALAGGRLVFQGNAIWGSGTRVYGSSASLSPREKLKQIRTAARVLTDGDLTPLAKAREVMAQPGFGPNSATGLVLVFHPDAFAIWNEVSKAVVGSFGGRTDPLEAFEDDVQQIRAELNAEDFLELDWFFYLVDRDRRRGEPSRVEPSSTERSYWALQGDPRVYDVARAVAEQEVDQWTTRGSRLAVGDRLAFWKTKGPDADRGVVGLGVVTSEPYMSLANKSQHWIKPPVDDKLALRVDVRYVELPSGPLWLNENPFLEEFTVARSRGGTTFKISSAQWDQLMDSIGGWPEREVRGVWWVNQRASFKEERGGGYLWAPLADKAGRTPPHWANLARAQVGDIVLSYAGGRIRAVSRVLAPAVAAKQPEELEERWNDDGRLLRVQYADIDAIELTRIPIEWRKLQEAGTPFNRNGGVKEGYFFPVAASLLDKLAEEFPSLENALGDLEGRQIRQRTWCVYVPRSGVENLRLAREALTWGAPEEGRLTGVNTGDRVLFVNDLRSDLVPAPSGFPRVPLDLFHGRAASVIEAEVTSGPFTSTDPIWPNAVYPERLRFRELNVQHDVAVNTEEMSASLVEATRRSALAGGRPILAEGVERPVTPFDVETIQAAAVTKGLRLDPAIIAQVVAALDSGKHVILTGPPGTAKTTLAEVVAGVATKAGRCAGHVLTTATADWTTYETIGGLRPNEKGELTFEQGHFLDAIDQNEWLVIDELNRSNFDRAFGQLFTVLSGQAVELPYRREPTAGRIVLAPNGAPVPSGADVMEIPPTWRIIATMNVFDKSLLFEMSFALMRRFAFVEVPSPAAAVFEALIDREAEDDDEAAALAKQFLGLRREKDVGPAVFMDLARFMRERRRVASVDNEQLAFEGFYSYLLPQFEGLDGLAGDHLFRAVKRLVGRRNHERLRSTLNAVLGLELRAEKSADEYAEEEGIDLDRDEELDGADEGVA